MQPKQEMDERTKEQLKRDGEYSPGYWRLLKLQRGWITIKHGNTIKHRQHRKNRRLPNDPD